MLPIKFKPTNFIIKENAINGLKAAKDNDAYFLSTEVIKVRTRTGKNERQGFVNGLKNLFRTKSQLDIVLDKVPKGQFVLRAERQLGSFRFLGNTIPIDLEQVLKGKEYLDKIILQSKEGILEQISRLNFNRKNIKLLKIR